MRARLFSDLECIGYEIFLEGNNIRYRYQKFGTPPSIARSLIDELRKNKAEVVSILKTYSTDVPTEKSQPPTKVKAMWPSNMHGLIDWFMALKPPAAPFDQETHIHVIDPAKYFASLKREIESGPGCPRGRNGALLYDLNTLRKIMH